MKTIHIIDDDTDLTLTLSDMIDDLGHTAHITNDPSLLDYKNICNADLLLIDLMLGKNDGIEVIRNLAKLDFKKPIILISGQHQSVINLSSTLAKEHNLNVISGLQKPLKLSRLKEALDNAFQEKEKDTSNLSSRKTEVLLTEIDKHIDKNEFCFYYQPQIALATETLSGYECLVRWKHPEQGILPPPIFIPYLEQNKLINKLFRNLVPRAFSEMAPLLASSNQTLSFNISTVQLDDLELPEYILEIATSHGIKPEQIIIEITESGMFVDTKSAYDVLLRFVLKGMKLSIDDFGTGSSTLEQLHTLPVSEIKIDKQFIMDSSQNPKSDIIVQNTVSLGKKLNLSIVAEGIEQLSDLVKLSALGVDIGQGYFFSKPLSYDQVIAYTENTAKARNEALIVS